jgi:hypothetical protein
VGDGNDEGIDDPIEDSGSYSISPGSWSEVGRGTEPPIGAGGNRDDEEEGESMDQVAAFLIRIQSSRG